MFTLKFEKSHCGRANKIFINKKPAIKHFTLTILIYVIQLNMFILLLLLLLPLLCCRNRNGSNESVIQNDVFIFYLKVRKQNQQMKTGNFMHKTNNFMHRGLGGML